MSLSLDTAKKFFDFLKSLMMISLFSLLFLIFCYHFRELNGVYRIASLGCSVHQPRPFQSFGFWGRGRWVL